MKKFLDNKDASAVPVVYFVLAIIGAGALYSLLFLEIGLPMFSSYVPDSDSKTFIMMGIYGLPLIAMIVGSLALLKEGLKREDSR